MVRERGVACVSLGCRVNRVESDAMAEALEGLGCELCDEREAAVVVVNTCAVTGEAQAKTRKAVRRAAGLPQRPHVVATGCAASLFASELEALGPRVRVEPDRSQVARVASDLLGGPGEPLPARREGLTPTGRTRFGVKVQDGCDRRCSYCIVWKARGPARSLAYDEAVAAVRSAVSRGAREVVLTGINLGCYRDGGRDLAGLVTGLLADTGVGRLRLGSVEPQDVGDRLARAMGESRGRVAPFLHVPLQSGCDATLRRMGRAYDAAGYLAAAEAVRARVPDVALACDLIVGFPGETDAEFAESLALCERVGFARMHVFRYSRRPGTPAADAPDQVPAEVSAARAAEARALAARMRRAALEARVGREELVVVQAPGRGVTGGLHDALVDDDAPVGSLVRARVRAVAPRGALDCRGGYDACERKA